MLSTAPPRRAVGLLAAGAVGVSTAIFGVAGVAHATPSYSVSGSGTTAAVPAGICAVDWTVVGASGGTGTSAGSMGGQLSLTLPAAEGDVFTLYPGTQGGTASGATAGTGGTNGYSDTSTAGQDGSTDGVTAGGGGGAASVVEQNGGQILLAFGGDGGSGGAPAGGAGGGGGANQALAQAGSYDPAATASSAGNGSITGTGVLCAAPEAPTGLSATGGDGELTVDFTPTWASGTGTNADSWEYSSDGGSTWTAVTPTDLGGQQQFTLSGLTNGTTYSIEVRGVSATVGVGAASTAVTGTPALPNGAPAHVVVTPGPSSYVVTWDAPTTAGTFPVAGYDVVWSGGQMGGILCENVPVSAARRCVGAAVPGSSYTVSVFAVDSQGNWGDPSADVPVGTVAEPTVPAAAPTSTERLTLPAGQTDSVTAGKQVTLSGSGYLPNSTITLIAYSSPQVLTSVVTDATGSFTVTVTVPDGLESGHHTLVASGVDPTGAVRYVTLPVTVTGGTTGSGGLAYTGFDVALPLTGGLIALVVGAVLMVAARRRKVADKAA